MTAKQLKQIKSQLTNGLGELEKTNIDQDQVYQQLVDATQSINRALRGLESREREKTEN